MGKMDFINNMIEQKLLSLHTCYLAKVLSIEGNTAKIQPLGKTKAYGKEAVSQSVLTDVPIINSALYRFDNDAFTTAVVLNGMGATLTVNESSSERNFAILRKLRAGDIVVCICAERNISAAKKGENNVPPAGHHSMSDSIIIGSL